MATRARSAPKAATGVDAVDRPVRVETAHSNEVRLVGRLSALPDERQLPSGDLVMSFRLVVERGPTKVKASPKSPTVDTLDCAAWRKDVQRTLRSAAAGDVLAVSGALRRRFWRSPGGSASRSEIEVTSLRRVSRPAT